MSDQEKIIKSVSRTSKGQLRLGYSDNSYSEGILPVTPLSPKLLDSVHGISATLAAIVFDLNDRLNTLEKENKLLRDREAINLMVDEYSGNKMSTETKEHIVRRIQAESALQQAVNDELAKREEDRQRRLISAMWSDPLPEIMYEHNRSILFGLFKIQIVTEDRKTTDRALRYKHMISFSFLKLTYVVVLRCSSMGSYFINGKEIF